MSPLEIFTIAALGGSVLLTVFGLGLRASPKDVVYLLTQPWLFARSLLVMAVIMPFFAIFLALKFELNRPVEIALVALSLSPVPPLLPQKLDKTGDSHSYTLSLLVTAAVFSILTIPVMLAWLNRVFSIPLVMSPLHVTQIVCLTVLAPLASGMLLKALAPRWVEKYRRLLSRIAVILLLIGVVPALILTGPDAWSLVGNGTILVFVGFTLLGLAAGILLGGPIRENRAVLGLAAAARHPGIAFAIAVRNFPEQQKAVLAGLVLYLIVNGLVTIPYLLWRRRSGGMGFSESLHR